MSACPDYEAAKAWYTEKLDFRVLQEWPYGDLQLAYLSPAADDDFHLELLAGPIPHPNPVLDDLGVSLEYGGYQHFCLHVDNVDAARAELIRRGVDVDRRTVRDRGHQPAAGVLPRSRGAT